MDSQKILNSDLSLIGYGQVVNSLTQVILAGMRTQATNDAQGTDTEFTEIFWNPVNNRINLQNARVNDIVNVDVTLSAVPVGSVFQVSVQLDYSPTLDGSLVISQTISRIIIVASAVPLGIQASFRFVVTQAMKDNGIGVMVTPFGTYTLVDTRFEFERFTVPT